MTKPAPISANNLPTPALETWKYTNLPRALPANLKLAEKPQEILIHKNRGQICEQPEDILFTGAENEQQQPALKIRLEEGARLTLIERHNGKNAYWKNMTTQIAIEEGAILTHIRIQNDSPQAIHTNMVEINLARNAHYNSLSLNTGAKLMRHEITAHINGTGTESHFNGLNLLSADQHGDTTILVEHKAPNSFSKQFYRSLLNDRAHGVFQGKVYVHKEAQKTDAYQLSNAILLSEHAEMDTKPELEIYADDVKCSHGSTCGQLDEEPLFYLRQRGINEAQARMLLLQAFIGEIIDTLDDSSVKEELEQKAEKWLSSILVN